MQVVQLALAFVLTLATIALFVATWRMARSTRDLVGESCKNREDSKKPKVSVKLKAYEEHGDFIQLVLTNLGKGAAFNVDFHLGGDQGVLTQQGVVMRGTLAPISFIASGESEIYEMGSLRALAGDWDSTPASFPVDVTYEDVDGKKHSEKITLDVKQFELVSRQGGSVAWSQMEAVKKLAAAAENIAKAYCPR